MVRVYLTIDTECSMGGAWDDPRLQPVPAERAILGRIGNQHYGIPLIMEILERHSLQGTFFLEVLAAQVVPEHTLAKAYQEVTARGHDVQLHLHPVFHYYNLFQKGELGRDQLPPDMDLIGSLPLETQVSLLQQGSYLFRNLVAKTPVAFRAGCFGSSRSTLAALARLVFLYDSSFNASYLGSGCLMRENKPTNTPWREGELWEVPITNFETGGWRLRGLKLLDVAAVSFLEMERVLAQAEHLGISTVVFLMHSFTLFKKADVQFQHLRPDRLVIRRFRQLCSFLQQNADRFHVETFSERPQFPSDARKIPFPRMGILLPLCRKVVQGVNRAPWI